MRRIFAFILRFFGYLRFNLLTETTASFPSGNIPSMKLLVVRDGEVDKWACLACPGGCGKAINLSLNPSRRPRWSVENDFWQQPTVHPSVHQINDCGCHFWIKNGRIEWCKGGRPYEANSTGVPDGRSSRLDVMRQVLSPRRDQ